MREHEKHHCERVEACVLVVEENWLVNLLWNMIDIATKWLFVIFNTTVFNVVGAEYKFAINDLTPEVQQRIINEFQDNNDVFEDVYNAYYDQIFKYLIKRTCDADEAYEICAETFVKAFESFHKFKWQGFSIKTWIFRIANNQLKNSYRKKKHNIISLEPHHLESDSLAFDAHEELKELDALLESDQELHELSTAIKKLKSTQQEVLSSFYFSNLSHKEIAKSIDKSPGAVKAILFRAVTNLRGAMNG
jgi:RNA polymerase sigma-70 factor (ECF subfamily)